MISFQRNGDPNCKTVFARIVADLSNVTSDRFWLHRDFETPAVAQLVCDHLNARMEELIARAHRLAYEQGWKDKGARRRKATEFADGFTDKEPGY